MNIEFPQNAKVHLIGICGTGMGALAGLLVQSGFQVSGSDESVYPPMSDQLAEWGIEVKKGYRPENLNDVPDLVIVGNVCRPDHVEAVAAIERGMKVLSLPGALRQLLLPQKKSLVVAGTHGKTTTSALTAYLLKATGREPSLFVGGVAADFEGGAHLGAGEFFVLEGDEYDSAYFEKRPKFLSYEPWAAVVTSVEYDHVDIYPDVETYEEAFSTFVELLPATGLLAVYAGDSRAVALCEQAKCPVRLYGVDGDPMTGRPHWLACPGERGTFELSRDGVSLGTWSAAMGGRHNLRNTLAAIIVCHEAAGVPLDELKASLPKFRGVKRRQEVVGRPGKVTIYDDFAHHPTAVKETVSALSELHAPGRLLVAFEPRSATACRRLHQERYAFAFDGAGMAIIAPVGRNINEDERLDTELLSRQITERGIPALAAKDTDEVLRQILEWSCPGDGVALLSNGGFGGLRDRVVKGLEAKAIKESS